MSGLRGARPGVALGVLLLAAAGCGGESLGTPHQGRGRGDMDAGTGWGGEAEAEGEGQVDAGGGEAEGEGEYCVDDLDCRDGYVCLRYQCIYSGTARPR